VNDQGGWTRPLEIPPCLVRDKAAYEGKGKAGSAREMTKALFQNLDAALFAASRPGVRGLAPGC
jgi:hypothetical protein